MGQIVGLNAKCKRANLNALSSITTVPANGEIILVSSDNSMDANGQGNFDCYIVGDGTKAASALTLQSMADEVPTSGSKNSVASDYVYKEVSIIKEGEYQTSPSTLANGTILNSSNTTCVNTADYISADVGDLVYVCVEKELQEEGGYYCYAFRTYNKNKTMVRNVTNVATAVTTPVIMETGEAFIRFTIGEYNSSGTLLTLRTTSFNGTTSYINAKISKDVSSIKSLSEYSKIIDELVSPVPIKDNSYIVAAAPAKYISSSDWYVSSLIPVVDGDIITTYVPSDINTASSQKGATYNSSKEFVGYFSLEHNRNVTIPSSSGIEYVSISIRKIDADKFILYKNGVKVYQGANSDISINVVKNEVEELKGEVESIESYTDELIIGLRKGEYITKQLTLANGTIPNPSNTTCVNTTTYISVFYGESVYINVVKDYQATGDYYCYGFATYDENKALLRNVTNVDISINIPVLIESKECYVRFSIAERDSENGLKTLRVTDFDGTTSYIYGKIYLNEDGIKNTLQLNLYKQSAMSAIASKIGIVSPTKPKTQYLCLVHMSDSHGDVTRYNRALEFANSQDNVAAILNTGDFSKTSYDTSDFENLYVAGLELTEIPTFPVVGNHDVSLNGAIGSGNETIANVTNRYITPYMSALGAVQGSGAYYYKDFTAFSIRLIVLCEYELPRIAAEDATNYTYNLNKRYISQTQTNWLISTLNSVPQGYGVLIAMHSPIDEMNLIDCDFTCSVPTTGVAAYAQNYIVQEIVDAYIQRGIIAKEYQNTLNAPISDIPNVSVNANFSSAEGEFICYLTGHTHRDYVGVAKHAEQRQLCICVSCGTVNRTYYSMADDLLREVNSQSEDLFNMIAFDTDRKQIRILRIGASQTADMRHREMACLSYSQSI